MDVGTFSGGNPRRKQKPKIVNVFFCSHPNAYLSKEIAAYKFYFCSEKQGFPTVPGNIC